jgi:hypothetical protein
MSYPLQFLLELLVGLLAVAVEVALDDLGRPDPACR